jgi:hypothetical protein
VVVVVVWEGVSDGVMVKGWLASDGEARFAWTGLREAARSVGGGEERLGLSVTLRVLTTQPRRGRGADEGCTTAIDFSKAGCGCEMEK